MKAFGFGVAALVFLLDQLSKYWILRVVLLPERGSVEVLPFFRLTFVGNVGVSMGLFRANSDLGRWLLVAVTAAIAGAVAVWIVREKQRPDVLALGLVLGGALGNIVDRVRFGYVVDFLHFFWGERSFWVFNVADAAITAGVLLLLVRALTAPKGMGHA
ncbi:lipoprotein signal peptidase [Polymorphobacter glacialis]|uniref:Lipoprotein signal peptidase n=1 Tax=Sandarakinorhabdus glacialis TaxID=1614636 RepID=A0A917EB41_9SPHN|nr:signal peptidase II [Polymorphobacter glacialis]GGE16516.1 lipoprotein signal peptidase [Polymorphobacter glacialis]